MKSAATGAVVIGAVSTGAGKTAVSMALMRLLAMNGVAVAPFKVGPDFIDTQFHEIAAGLRSINLDGFMTSANYIRETVAGKEAEGFFCIMEGMMGLFDGLSARGDFASTAWVSKVLDAPVVLVLDVSATMRTAAAVASGVTQYARRRGVRIAGVILSRTGSKGHFEGCRSAIEGAGLRVLGHIPESPEFRIKERHLGLSLPENMQMIAPLVDSIAVTLGESLDIGEFIRLFSRPARQISVRNKRTYDARVRIGVATDYAFNFYYQDNMELLRRAGADIVPFSPINDKSVDMFDGLYIGGGYPELYASSISQNTPMLSSLRRAAENGMPIYAECGGFMALCRKLEFRGTSYSMAGVFDAAVALTQSPVIGYRKVRTNVTTLLGERGLNARGHEFHYAAITDDAPEDRQRLFRVWNARTGSEEAAGLVSGNAAGSFLHLHFGSGRSMAGNIVNACINYSRS